MKRVIRGKGALHVSRERERVRSRKGEPTRSADPARAHAGVEEEEEEEERSESCQECASSLPRRSVIPRAAVRVDTGGDGVNRRPPRRRRYAVDE